jgi:hypothetical protein
MEFSTIMQALVKDMAEQLRPMVADMVRQELINGHMEKMAAELTAGRLSDIAQDIDLAALARHIDSAALAGELTDSQLETIAEEIDLKDLAGNLNLSDLTGELDGALSDWFQNQSFTITP